MLGDHRFLLPNPFIVWQVWQSHPLCTYILLLPWRFLLVEPSSEDSFGNAAAALLKKEHNMLNQRVQNMVFFSSSNTYEAFCKKDALHHHPIGHYSTQIF